MTRCAHRSTIRFLAWGALLFVAAGVAGAACTTHQCDASAYDYLPRTSPDAGGGYMVDPDTFVTNDWNEPWLSYPGQVTVHIWFPPEVAGRYPDDLAGQIGTSPAPNVGTAANWTPASGQLAYFNNLQTDGGLSPPPGVHAGGGLSVTNGTCQTYFARFTVHFGPRASAVGGESAASATDMDAQSAADGGPANGDGSAAMLGSSR